MISGGYTATGPRDTNEDNLYFREFVEIRTTVGGITSFVMVSDGMGGYQCGDVASGLAVASAKSYIDQLIEMARGNLIEFDPMEALSEIARNAHDAIVAESASRGGIGMGATFVAAFANPTHAWVAHVGDSRAYLVRAGATTQLTEDHSKVGRLLSHGVITEDEARSHPDRNRIERALGFGDATPDTSELDLQEGDSLVLCSDGVYTEVNSTLLGDCVSKAHDAVSAAEDIVRQAIKRGTDDNSTAVVLMNRKARESRPLRGAKAHKNPYEKSGVQDTPRHVAVIIVLLAGISLGALSALFLGQLKPLQGNSSPAPSVDATPIVPSPETSDSSEKSSGAGFMSVRVPADAELVLKYVDAEGTAQRFTYSLDLPNGDVSLAPNSLLVLSETTDTFGRADKGYQVLSEEYLEDLRADVAQCREGGDDFNSSLAQVCEYDQYVELVNALSASDGSMLVDSIDCLIVDAIEWDEDEDERVDTSQISEGRLSE